MLVSYLRFFRIRAKISPFPDCLSCFTLPSSNEREEWSDMDLNASQNFAHPTNERRSLKRFALSLPARIEKIPRSENNTRAILDLITKDICASGAFFLSTHPLNKGTPVKIDLILTPEKSRNSRVWRALIEVNGVVLRRDPDGMAVNFEKRYRLIPLNYS